MNAKLLSESGDAVRLLVNGASHTLLNAIRRTVANNVPVLAIEDLYIHKNDSVVFDEMLASRLAFVPLKTDPKAYKEGERVSLSLDAVGPKTVYAGDIVCKDPSVEVAAKKVPLAKLGENQALKLDMEAVMATGRGHAKWQAGLVAFHAVPSLKNKKAVPKKRLDAVLAAAPAGQLEVRAGKLVLKDPYNADLGQGALKGISPDEIEVVHSATKFTLLVESYGQLTPREILSVACERLLEKLKAFEEVAKKRLR